MPHVTRPDGVRIAWAEHGSADAPPVLLCTMATAAMTVWEPVVARLGGRWRLIVHDRRGDGDSDPGAPESHTFQAFRDDALAVMDAAGAQRAAVCGMAFGARVATRIALDKPERVRGLALFDATGAAPAVEAERTAGSETARALRRAAGMADIPVDRDWFARRDPAGRGLNGAALRGQPAWTPGLQEIAIPTLVACGDHDPNLDGAKRMAKEIPGARFELMPMTGHASILDRPDLVAGLLADFLDGLKAP